MTNALEGGSFNGPAMLCGAVLQKATQPNQKCVELTSGRILI